MDLLKGLKAKVNNVIDFFSERYNILKVGYREMFNEYIDQGKSATPYHMIFGIALTLFAIIANTIAKSYMIGMFSPGMAMFLGSVVIAPFVEEYIKQIAVKYNAGLGFIIIFGLFEFASYCLLFYPIVGPWIFLIRVPALLMHLYTIALQKYYIHLSRYTTDPAKIERLQAYGFKVAVMTHAIFNLIVRFV